MCGSEAAADALNCAICRYSFARSGPSNLGGLKCARCGSSVERGFDFCPICGLNQRERLARPDTKVLAADGEPAPPSVENTVPAAGPPIPPGGELRMPAVSLSAAVASSPAGISARSRPGPDATAMPVDRTVMAPAGPPIAAPFVPSLGAMPAAPMGFVRVADPSVTVRPPGGADHAQGAAPGGPAPPPGFVITAAVSAAAASPAPPGPVGDDDRTIPAPGRSQPMPAQGATVDRAGPGPGDSDPTVHYIRPPAMAMHGVPAEVPIAGDETHRGSPPHSPDAAALSPQPVVAAGGREASRTPTHPGSALARLVLVGRDGSEGERFALVGDRLTLGRRTADVLFPEDEFLSPTHARIERSGDSFWLVDLGSHNGVYLRIRQHASIYPGDSFMIGHQLLRVENVDSQIEEAAPVPDGTRLFGTPLQPAWGKVVLVGRGGLRGDQFALRGARVVFGRECGDVLFPNDPFVSREHARLRLELNGSTMSVFIEDLNSANGTYIRIRGAVELHHRDTFTTCDQIIR